MGLLGSDEHVWVTSDASQHSHGQSTDRPNTSLMWSRHHLLPTLIGPALPGLRDAFLSTTKWLSSFLNGIIQTADHS